MVVLRHEHASESHGRFVKTQIAEHGYGSPIVRSWEGRELTFWEPLIRWSRVKESGTLELESLFQEVLAG